MFKAERIFDEIAASPQESIQEDVLQEYLYVKAQLLFKQQKFEEALKLLDLLTPHDTVRFSNYRFVPEIYKLQAEINQLQGNYTKALEFTAHYNEISDSMNEEENAARSMIILAEKNNEITRRELEETKHKLFRVFFGSLALLFILIVVIIFYRKLYTTKLELVKKSKNNVSNSETPKAFVLNNVTENTDHEENQIQQQLLIKGLKELMEKEKLFLDPKINIQDVASKLKSNRTYLSRAINSQLNTTFPNFINEYRICNSIHLINSGFMEKHTQESLATQSGFANRTVFISAFKKYTGVLPSFFIANYKKWEMEKKTDVTFE